MTDKPMTAERFENAPRSAQLCVTHHACACHRWMADQFRRMDNNPNLVDLASDAFTERLARATDEALSAMDDEWIVDEFAAAIAAAMRGEQG